MENNKLTPDTELNAAVWIIERLLLIEKQQIERSRIRRAVDESAEMFASANMADWHRWFVEACHSLGRSCRVIDATPDELAELAMHRVVIVIRTSDGVWRSLTGHGRRSVRLLTAQSKKHTRKISYRGLKKLLSQESPPHIHRCVVVEPASLALKSEMATERDGSPFGRVLSLLRAERADVWVVLVFALVSGLLGITTPLAVEALVNTVAFGRFLQPVIVLSLMLLAFLLFQAAVKALQTFVVEIIQRRLFARIAADLSFRLPRTTADAFAGTYPPELVNRFFDIVMVQKILAQMLLDGVTVVLSAIVGMTVLAFYHPFLLAFDLVLILLLFFTVFVLGRGAVTTSIKESKTKYAMASWLEDLARCRTSFRHHGAPEFALERSNQLIYNYLNARKKHFGILMRQIVFMLLIKALASTALLGIGGWLVISGQLSLGQLVAAELIVAIVVGAFAKLGKHVESFYDLLASMDKLGQLLDLKMERSDGILSIPVTGGIVGSHLNYDAEHGALQIEDLTFRIDEGQHTAVIGASGAGPHYFLEILFGLREPDSGVITIHGVNPRDVRPDVLRHRLALACDVEIFEGTIAENVHMARPGVSASNVRAALEVTGLLTSVLRLPAGLDTQLTQTGFPMTAAQLSRLMLARAVAGQPDYLCIDGLLDRFSDFDSGQLLDRLLSGNSSCTLIIATIRESIKNRLSQIIVVNEAIEEIEARV